MYRDNVKMLRVKYDKTQQDMADLLSISRTSYSKKEKGYVPYTLAEAKKIADCFSLTVDEIFFGDIVHTKGTVVF